ncbi:MAG: hypothetical protein V3U24_02285 [Candidatus Neomarinimicrobiota bacterium]
MTWSTCLVRQFGIGLALCLSPVFGISTLHHIPPGTQRVGETVQLEAIVVGDATVLEARVFFRTVGHNAYHETGMTFEGGSWRGTISPEFLTREGVEYALVFRMADGSSLAFPREDPFGSPQRLAVEARREEGRSPGEARRVAGAALRADVLIIGPGEGQIIPAADVLIMASLFNVRNVDLNSIAIFLDNRNVTAEAAVSPEIISYVPSSLLPGRHTVRIELSNTYGHTFRPVSWTFTVAARSAGIVTASDEFSYKGKIRTDMTLDRVDRRLRSIGETVTRLEGGWPWLGLRVDVRVASDESKLRQPRNRYGITANSGDNITVNLGDFTSVLSPYTIDGKRIRGVGIDVNLNLFRFQLVNGDLERSIQGSPDTDKSYQVAEIRTDSLSGKLVPLYILDRRGYTFQRKVRSYRVGLNFRNRFQFALNFQKAKDEIPTVEKDLRGARFTVFEDTLLGVAQIDTGVYSLDEFKTAIEGKARYELAATQWGGDTPQDNVVLGFDLDVAFDDRRLTFEVDWAMSLLNRNIWDGAITRTGLDTLLDDTKDNFMARTYEDDSVTVVNSGFPLEDVVDPSTFEDFFVVNQYMTPLVPIDLEGYGKTPLAAIMNMPSAAYNFGMRAYYYNNTFKMRYSQIGPEFKSLANPYLSSNLREFTLSDRVRFIENKMAVNFEYKHRDNAILRDVVDEYAQNTVSGNFTLTPGLDLPSFSTNFQSVQRSNGKTESDTLVWATITGEDSISLEDRREDTRTQNKLFSLNFPLRRGDVRYNIQGTFSSVEVVDLLEKERDEGFSPPNSKSSSYSMTASAKYIFPLRLALNLSGYTYELPSAAVTSSGKRESKLTSVGMDASYATWGNRLKIQGGLSISRATGISEFSYYGIKASAELEPLRRFVTRAAFSTKIRHVEKEVDLATLAVKFSANYVF